MNRQRNTSPLVRAIVARLPRFTGPNILCAILLGALIAITMGCTLDRERVERTREDLQLLCGSPVTQALKEWCAEWAPGITGPTDLLPGTTRNGPAE